MSTTAGNGGYLIPFALDPTINLSNSGSINPFRSIARVETLSNSNIWHGITSAGVTAEWTAEAAEFADASPQFTQPSVTPIKGDVYVQASWEVWQDSNIDQQLSTLFADAKDRLEATAFCSGTGSTQPFGLITRLSTTTASRVNVTTNGTFTSVDVFATAQNLSARWQPNAKWLASYQLGFTIRQFGVGSSPAASSFWADLGSAQPPTLLGRPFIECSGMTGTLSAATASSDSILCYGDFSEFLVVDRLGATVVPNPVVLGSSRRPTGEIGMSMYFRVGSDVLVTDAFRLLTA
jgi:HK97 family phage major capsid protein